MFTITPAIDAASIVIIGKFNPKIITPHWLALNGLISPEDADNSEVEIIHDQVSKFAIGDRIIQVTNDRFSIEISSPPAVDICDLTMRIFGEFLNHTPLSNIGINRSVHFKIDSYKKLMGIGENIAPKLPWGTWGEKLTGEGLNKEDLHLSAKKSKNLDILEGRIGGLRTITMEQSVRTDEYDGFIQVQVQPSTLHRPGIFINVNDHYEFSGKDGSSLTEILEILGDSWNTSRGMSESIINDVMAMRGDI